MSFMGACVSVEAPPPTIPAEIVWRAEGKFCEPETVLALPDDTLLVSNVCGFQSANEGFLSLLDADGTVIDWRIVNGLDSPLGMAFQDGQVFVIDANKVKVFSWPGFSDVREIPLETVVANDIAVSSEGVLYVSDTAKGNVVEIRPDGESSLLVAEAAFSGANGVEIHPDGSLFVGGKKLWRVTLATGRVETIGPDWLTDIDGIEFEPDGVVQVTPVGGPLVRIHPNGRMEIIGGPEISSANHGYAPSLDLVLIPTGYDNTVLAIRPAPDAARVSTK